MLVGWRPSGVVRRPFNGHFLQFLEPVKRAVCFRRKSNVNHHVVADFQPGHCLAGVFRNVIRFASSGSELVASDE